MVRECVSEAAGRCDIYIRGEWVVRVAWDLCSVSRCVRTCGCSRVRDLAGGWVGVCVVKFKRRNGLYIASRPVPGMIRQGATLRRR